MARIYKNPRIELLKKLRRKLRTKLVANHFDMNSWAKVIPGKGIKELNIINNGCGTTACAAGWLTTIPGSGLRLSMIDTTLNSSIQLCRNGVIGLKAAASALGISYNDAEYLFSTGSYQMTLEYPYIITPDMVADHITKLLTKYKT